MVRNWFGEKRRGWSGVEWSENGLVWSEQEFVGSEASYYRSDSLITVVKAEGDEVLEGTGRGEGEGECVRA